MQVGKLSEFLITAAAGNILGANVTLYQSKLTHTAFCRESPFAASLQLQKIKLIHGEDAPGTDRVAFRLRGLLTLKGSRWPVPALTTGRLQASTVGEANASNNSSCPSPRRKVLSITTLHLPKSTAMHNIPRAAEQQQSMTEIVMPSLENWSSDAGVHARRWIEKSSHQQRKTLRPYQRSLPVSLVLGGDCADAEWALFAKIEAGAIHLPSFAGSAEPAGAPHAEHPVWMIWRLGLAIQIQ